jgi:hypothetical protein
MTQTPGTYFRSLTDRTTFVILFLCDVAFQNLPCCAFLLLVLLLHIRHIATSPFVCTLPIVLSCINTIGYRLLVSQERYTLYPSRAYLCDSVFYSTRPLQFTRPHHRSVRTRCQENPPARLRHCISFLSASQPTVATSTREVPAT